MVAQKGKDFLLKIQNGSGFDTIAGIRSRKLSFNAQTVDITDGESAGRWRELLAGAGVQRASVAGSGIFRDATSDETLRDAFFNGKILTYQILVPGFGTITGLFQVTALDYGGEHNGEVTFEVALESAGPLVFGAL